MLKITVEIVNGNKSQTVGIMNIVDVGGSPGAGNYSFLISDNVGRITGQVHHFRRNRSMWSLLRQCLNSRHTDIMNLEATDTTRDVMGVRSGIN